MKSDYISAISNNKNWKKTSNMDKNKSGTEDCGKMFSNTKKP